MYGSYRSKKSYYSIRSLEVIANSLFGCILSHKAFVLTPLTSLNSLTSPFAKEFLIFINMLPQR